MGRRPNGHEPMAAAVAVERWVERLERWPLPRLTMRRVIVVLVLGFLLLLSAQQWYQYQQVARTGVPVADCSSSERTVDYDVEWQWVPPGLVCLYRDGTREYVGL